MNIFVEQGSETHPAYYIQSEYRMKRDHQERFSYLYILKPYPKSLFKIAAILRSASPVIKTYGLTPALPGINAPSCT